MLQPAGASISALPICADDGRHAFEHKNWRHDCVKLPKIGPQQAATCRNSPLKMCTPGYTRRNRHNARQINRHRPSANFPVVSVFAFLKLADWHEAYRNGTQGGKSCDKARKEPFSGERISESTGKLAAALASPSRRDSSASLAGAQPDHHPAASAASKRQGGGT